LTTALAWSPAGLFVQAASFGAVPLGVFGITAARFILASAVLLPVVWVARAHLVSTLRQPVTWALAAIMIAYYLTAVTTFTLTTVAEGTLLINSTPLFALAIRLARRQPVTRREGMGALIAFGGLCLILLPDLIGGEGGNDRLLGAALALGAALTGALYSLIFSGLRTSTGPRPDPGIVTLLTFGLGALMTLPMLPPLPDLKANAGALLGLGIIVTAIPTFLYSVASSRLPAVLVTTVRLLTPVVGTLLAVWIWNEVLSVPFWIGAALVLAGLYLLVRPDRA
jgi:drug/metabolite transporter (DMT)-like permease